MKGIDKAYCGQVMGFATLLLWELYPLYGAGLSGKEEAGTEMCQVSFAQVYFASM